MKFTNLEVRNVKNQNPSNPDTSNEKESIFFALKRSASQPPGA